MRGQAPDLERAGGYVRDLWAHPLAPAVAGWAVLGFLAGGYDLWLIRRGYLPLTAAARSPMGTAARRYLTGHFDEQLGIFDLFALAGRMAARSGTR